MLSFMSAISVSLITSLATAPADSARILASTAEFRADATAGASADAELRRAVDRRVLSTASRYVGTRYRLGGSKPGAFDCSGFVRYVYGRHGMSLPRTANDQSTMGYSIVVGIDSLEVGDLLFFRTPRGRASHVAIYAGGGRIIHASAGSRRVRYDDLASPRGRWFIEHLSSVRRLAPESLAAGRELKVASR
jgi:cell wall-associated NlpC family hydrolase